MSVSLQKFIKDTSGAVAVDWIVLSAAITGLGISSVAAVRTGVNSLAADTQSSLSSVTVASLGDLSGLNSVSFGDLLVVSAEWMQAHYDDYVESKDPLKVYETVRDALLSAKKQFENGNYEGAAKYLDYASAAGKAFTDMTGKDLPKEFVEVQASLTEKYNDISLLEGTGGIKPAPSTGGIKPAPVTGGIKPAPGKIEVQPVSKG